jgi:hypothetical protein
VVFQIFILVIKPLRPLRTNNHHILVPILLVPLVVQLEVAMLPIIQQQPSFQTTSHEMTIATRDKGAAMVTVEGEAVAVVEEVVPPVQEVIEVLQILMLQKINAQ